MLPAISAISLLSVDPVTRMGFVAESFLLMDAYSEDSVVEEHRERGKSGGTVYIAEIDPVMSLRIAARVMQRRGVGNSVVGTSLSLSAIKNYLDNGAAEDRFGYLPYAGGGIAYGVLILKRAKYDKTDAGDLHRVELNLSHELAAWTPVGHTDPDGTGSDNLGGTDTIEVPGGDTSGGVPVDAEFLAYRFFWDATPPRGETDLTRSGYFDRILPTSLPLSFGEIYSFGSPPSGNWNSANECGMTYDNNFDGSISTWTTRAGTYALRAVYFLNEDEMLMGTTESNNFDSASYGNKVIAYCYLAGSGDAAFLYGDFPDTASVIAHLGLADTSTLACIFEATTGTEYFRSSSAPHTIAWTTLGNPKNVRFAHGNLPTLAAFLSDISYGSTTGLGTAIRIDTDEVYFEAPTAETPTNLTLKNRLFAHLDFRDTKTKDAGYYQIYHLYGHRTGGGTWEMIRISYRNFDSAAATDFWGPNAVPTVPGPAHYNETANLTKSRSSLEAVYCHSGKTFDLGSNGTVTGMGRTAPVVGSVLWVFQYNNLGSNQGSLKWDWRILNSDDIDEFLAAQSLHALSSYLVIASYYRTDRVFHKGSEASGDPLINCEGISRY